MFVGGYIIYECGNTTVVKIKPNVLLGMTKKDNPPSDSIYKALCEETPLSIDTIKYIKGFMSREDWNRKDTDYFTDPYDHTFLKQFKNRLRKCSFTWPFHKI